MQKSVSRYLLNSSRKTPPKFVKSKKKVTFRLNLNIFQVHDWGHFSQQVKLKAFKPFTSAANALDNMNAISEGLMHEDLKAFLTDQLPKGQSVGINDSRLLQVVKDELSVAVAGGDIVQESV